jgi:8-oxo-dGTP diphosphatase
MDRGAATVVSQQLGGGLVRAAGGIVARLTEDGKAEVVVVHRPHRLDWTFPKGKLDHGESFEDCARREVLEETGLRCRLGRFVGHTQYLDKKDRPKVVAYWVMGVAGGAFSPNEEVDELRWVPVDEVASVLTYDRDRELLASVGPALHEALPPT